jgi:hypothetical protein
MQVRPPTFPSGPVDGAALTKAFAIFYKEVLARMDLRYQKNDFGGLGQNGQVLTSTGVSDPAWADTGFPIIPNDTVVGNVSGGTATAQALTEAQLTALVNLVTNTLSGAVPSLPNDATKFFNGAGAYAVPAYPTAANPTAKVGLSAINGAAATFMRSDGAPQLDQAIVPTWTGAHTFSAALNANLGITVTGAAFTSRGITDNATSTILTVKSSGTPSVGIAAISGQVGLQVNGNGTDAIVASCSGSNLGVNVISASGSNASMSLSQTATSAWKLYNTATTSELRFNDGTADRFTMALGGSTKFGAAIGVNGNSAPAQVTGWGSPTGASVVNNFPGGGPATLAQCSNAIAQIITDMKALGFYAT